MIDEEEIIAKFYEQQKRDKYFRRYLSVGDRVIFKAKKTSIFANSIDKLVYSSKYEARVCEIDKETDKIRIIFAGSNEVSKWYPIDDVKEYLTPPFVIENFLTQFPRYYYSKFIPAFNRERFNVVKLNSHLIHKILCHFVYFDHYILRIIPPIGDSINISSETFHYLLKYYDWLNVHSTDKSKGTVFVKCSGEGTIEIPEIFISEYGYEYEKSPEEEEEKIDLRVKISEKPNIF